MTEQEFAEVLQYLQAQMRLYNLTALNDRIVADIRLDPGRPSDQLDRYLDALLSELRLQDEAAVRRIVETTNEFVRTETGGPVEGLSLVLSDSDRETFGRDTVDLGEGPDFTSLIRGLERLRGELLESHEDR